MKEKITTYVEKEYLTRITQEINEGTSSIEDVVVDLYYDEFNYNNGDKTSGQTVFTQEELKTMIENFINET